MRTTLLEGIKALIFNRRIHSFTEETDLIPTLNLIHKTIDKCYPVFYEAPVVHYFKEYHSSESILERSKKGYTLVYRVNDTIIGTGSLIDDYINAVYVDPKYQGKGIGKRIMQVLIKKAKQKKLSKLRLDATPGSKKFYNSLGFILLKDEVMKIDKIFPLYYYVMEKDLS